MKVCTDATLFGAMAPIKGGETVLDIGTGTGLLALVSAQLGASNVTAVELTEAAWQEAATNFSESPWADCMEAVHQDIQSFAAECDRKFDLIICNPPFFHDHSKTKEQLRRTARHTDELPFDELFTAADKLLGDNGIFYLLIPIHAVENAVYEADEIDLKLIAQTDIRGYERNAPKVSALTFNRWGGDKISRRMITIYREERVYSDESEKYLSPFLLRFAEQKTQD